MFQSSAFFKKVANPARSVQNHPTPVKESGNYPVSKKTLHLQVLGKEWSLPRYRDNEMIAHKLFQAQQQTTKVCKEIVYYVPQFATSSNFLLLKCLDRQLLILMSISLVFLDYLLTSKTVANNHTSVETDPDICKNITNKSSDDTTTTAKLFKMEPKEQNKFEKCKKLIWSCYWRVLLSITVQQ